MGMSKLKIKYEVTYVDDNGHYYIIDGRKYGSVTSVLGIIGGQKTNALMAWSKKVALQFVSEALKNQLGKAIKIDDEFIDTVIKAGSQKPKYEVEKAADYGSRTHTAIDNYIVSKQMPADNEIMPSFNGFLKFLKEHNFNIICGDLVVGSKKYGFGGRLDGIAVDDKGNYIIIDFKTSNFVSPDYFLQVSAYAHCFSEMYGVPLPEKCYILKFAKDKPIYEIIEVNNVQRYFEAFLAAKKLKEVVDELGK